MATITKSVDVHVPVSTAYDQWTQFESFPQFMSGVDRIEQLTPTKTHWKTSIAGVTREFDAEITEQHPDERVAWRSTNGPAQSGVVTLHRLDASTTRIHLQMDYEPSGLVEKAGSGLGLVERQIQGDLERFREFIEARGQETGAWRGDVPRAPQKPAPNATTQNATAGDTGSTEPPKPGPSGRPKPGPRPGPRPGPPNPTGKPAAPDTSGPRPGPR
ncbi:carbon monoxide dehydrogenase subunit G [Actinoalloteichus hoggarensis]|uniref:Polyketide cyclase / dehydrase and lipid transport n=1 Tax=Actinoalloteichus hoggarensis TaxID=1470176 RepID=A0A221W2B1_9PSEU|nr:SRPBCC family protein [Actinoalloteichus hoggarensis]ASO19857.1 Polyketide cyclase / dehydrase and lipid transport [Actinoalloteichus hoggarensis]MBB5919434.1 carbon monoxide dehydrogenase subunit G [Actinoalloteichus hoggarensis]